MKLSQKTLSKSVILLIVAVVGIFLLLTLLKVEAPGSWTVSLSLQEMQPIQVANSELVKLPRISHFKSSSQVAIFNPSTNKIHLYEYGIGETRSIPVDVSEDEYVSGFSYIPERESFLLLKINFRNMAKVLEDPNVEGELGRQEILQVFLINTDGETKDVKIDPSEQLHLSSTFTFADIKIKSQNTVRVGTSIYKVTEDNTLVFEGNEPIYGVETHRDGTGFSFVNNQGESFQGRYLTMDARPCSPVTFKTNKVLCFNKYRLGASIQSAKVDYYEVWEMTNTNEFLQYTDSVVDLDYWEGHLSILRFDELKQTWEVVVKSVL